jgi:outer membrane protein OmpA-like peptidoglycan-associated protein
MTRSPRAVALACALATAPLLAACGPQRVDTPGRSSGPDLIVLLPDPEGDVGRASVSRGEASVDLANARDFTIVGLNQPPTKVRTMSESDVKRLFGDVLEAMPPAPQSFTLFFRFESDELTDESRALLPDVLKAMKDRPFPEVLVVGHTDTTGTAGNNFALGMKRGMMVRNLLLEAGLPEAAVEVNSHGEAVLLVKTADETYEPRNRRVEVTIR